MRNIILLYIVLIIASATGCSRHSAADSALDRADSLMESRPDSALTLLRAIDSSSLSRRATCARYALLMSQALDKNYIDVTSDSLISIATAYYADSPDSPELMKSLFYRARTYYNDSRFDRATIDATHAYEIAVKLDDPFWTGKTADLLADIFNETYNYEECINYRNIAVTSYSKTGERNFYQWALLNLSNDYINIQNYENACSIIETIQTTENDALSDSSFTHNYINTLFEYHVAKGEYQNAKNDFDRLIKLNFQKLSAIEYGNIGYVESSLGNQALAKLYIDSAYNLAQKDNVNDYFAADIANWEYLKLYGTKNDIINFTYRIIETQNRLVEESIKQSALGAQRDFYNHQSELAAEKESKMREYVAIGIIIATVIIVALIIFFKTRMTLKNNAIELKINEVALLSAEIDKRENECRLLKSQLTDISEKADAQPDKQAVKLRQLVNRLLVGRFNSINKILDEYYENTNTSTAKVAIYNRVEKELKNLASSKSMNEIENMVNDALDGIMTNFRNEFPDASKEDISIFMLNAAGLSQKAISLLMEIKLKSLYTKRARLKERIMKSDTAHKQNFINYLS